jgi:hypothetical protein
MYVYTYIHACVYVYILIHIRMIRVGLQLMAFNYVRQTWPWHR